MFKTRFLTDADYEILVEWWKFWRFPAPLKEMLPDNGIGGLMIEKDDEMICAGFLFLTNSKMCWIEYIVANPKCSKDDRKKGIVVLIEDLGFIAKQQGFSASFTSLKKESLIEMYELAGWKKGSTNTTEMVKIL